MTREATRHMSSRVSRATGRMARISAACTIAGVLAGLSACAHVDNDRLVLSNLEDLDAPGGAYLAEAPPYGPTETIGRHNWSPMLYVVPIDSTIHGPTYAPMRSPTEATQRQRGAHPTLAGAFDFTGGSEPRQIRQGFTQPLVTLVDALLIIPRAVMLRPTAAVESPRLSYQRGREIQPYRPAIRQAERRAEPPAPPPPPAPEPAPEPTGEDEQVGERIGLAG